MLGLSKKAMCCSEGCTAGKLAWWELGLMSLGDRVGWSSPAHSIRQDTMGLRELREKWLQQVALQMGPGSVLLEVCASSRGRRRWKFVSCGLLGSGGADFKSVRCSSSKQQMPENMSHCETCSF